MLFVNDKTIKGSNGGLWVVELTKDTFLLLNPMKTEYCWFVESQFEVLLTYTNI